MSAAVFPFRFLRRGFVEYLSFRTAVDEMGGGRRVTQKLHGAGELVVRGTLLFPNPGGTYAEFAAFWAARSGAFEAFLYRPQDKDAAGMVDGAAATAGQVDFPASRRYVDATTLEVRKNGALQTLATHYTLQDGSGGSYVLGTSPKLVVHFLAAPGVGIDVELSYDFLYPVRFDGDDLPDDMEIETGGRGAAGLADRTLSVQLRETGPGFSFADAPNAL